jgi:hypothetical protein
MHWTGKRYPFKTSGHTTRFAWYSSHILLIKISQDFDCRVTVLSGFWLSCYCSLMILTVVLLFSHDFDCHITVLSWFWLSCYCSLRILTVVLLFSQGDCRVTVLSWFWSLRYSSLDILIVIVQFPSILAAMFSKEFYFYDTVLPRVLLLQLLMFGDGWTYKISLNMASFNIGFYLTFSTKHFVSRYN